ncbi:MAG: PVC-type heme-binding CxxCH protein [Planctomycetota bacterium]
MPALATLALLAPQVATPPPPPGDFRPRVAPASSEARDAIARFQVPDGFRVELFAAEPLLANPVAFTLDVQGNAYVAESFRLHDGVTDIRDHMDWLEDDLACRTVEDRVAMYRKHLGDRFGEYSRAFERVRLLKDTDGDGVADTSTTFSDRFSHAADGIGAGVLVNGGDVYYTCIPSLWRLRDEDGDGRADVEAELSTGYGLRVSLLGHDLHGLALGPDGRLYFSCGDRGLNVTTQEGGVLDVPYTGAVLRCELDGSKLELFATGLRNPQELVFDAWGNLFTGDNNGDGGDKARLVHVVEGAEIGWRQAYQWLHEPAPRGPWNDEKLWQPHFDGQAAFIVPPIANLADGPSGITVNPGTGMSPRYDGKFFLCDFHGDPRTSAIWSFGLKAKGASFELDSPERFVTGSLVTDCEFGPDGALYFSDWVEGWNQTGKGRIYRIFEPDVRASKEVRTTRDILVLGAQGFDPRELVTLLAHPDQRVRTMAHLRLADFVIEKPGAMQLLEEVALDGPTLLARVHAIWGIGVAWRKSGRRLISYDVFKKLFHDPESEIRAQTARIVGESRSGSLSQLTREALRDAKPRVRMHAALAIGSFGRRVEYAWSGLTELLADTGDSDPVLRHAAIYALSKSAPDTLLADLSRHKSPHVRIGAAVALRRQVSPLVARFLGDSDQRVAAEAARAIYDLPIAEAMPELADVLRRGDLTERALVRRAIHAAFRSGREGDAHALAAYARTDSAPPDLRREALLRLAEWTKPPSRDAITGELWRVPAREAPYLAGIARDIAASNGEHDVGDIGLAPSEVTTAWIRFVRSCDAASETPLLASWVRDPTRERAVRVSAMEALDAMRARELAGAVEIALGDGDGQLRAAAVRALPKLGADEALPLLARVVKEGELAEKRAAYAALATIEGPRASELLLAELARLRTNGLPAELALDLLEAVDARGKEDELARSAAEYRAGATGDPLLARYRDALLGGDASLGRKVFRAKDELACLRCHKIESGEGGEVGPDMRGAGARLGRLGLLEAIALPNARRAPGFQNTVFTLEDGTHAEGRVIAEENGVVRVLDAQGVTREIATDDIEVRREGLSAMPDGLDRFLTPREMRDLIEYLSTLE